MKTIINKIAAALLKLILKKIEELVRADLDGDGEIGQKMDMRKYICRHRHRGNNKKKPHRKWGIY